jgi:hypothetical protein
VSKSSDIKQFIEQYLSTAAQSLIWEQDKNQLAVGAYRVITHPDGYAVMHGRHRKQMFAKKSWAIAQAFALSTGKKLAADQLSKLGTTLDRLLTESNIYEHHIKQKIFVNDSVGESIYQSRLSRCQQEIDEVEFAFSKVIKLIGIV